MTKFAQGIFKPRNPEKYIGQREMIYRSSWELAFANFCDNHPSVISWASESIQIPYYNPVKGKQTIYVPDFLVVYVDKDGQQHGELIEVKPSKETVMERARSTRDRLVVAINLAKWRAAQAWCRQQGLRFRVVTENELFMNTKGRR
jgi:hypothetical protein